MATRCPARLILILLLALTPVAHAQPKQQAIDFNRIDPAEHAFDHWYLTTINQQPAGYWRDWMIVADDTIRTGYEDVRHESHAGQATVTRMRIEWVETRDYQPIRITTLNQTSDQSITKTYRFTDEGIELTSTQGDRSVKQTLAPIKGEYLTAAQRNIAIHLLRNKHSERDDPFSFETLDPMVGMTPYKTTYQRNTDRDQPIKLHDASLTESSAWKVNFSVLPGFVMHEWADADQRVVMVAFDMQGLSQVSRLADKDVVNTAFVAPEMSGRSIIVPDRPIESINRVKQAVYELHADAISKEHLPMRSRHQRVVLIEPGKARVTVDLSAAPRPAAKAGEPDRPGQAYRASSVMIDYNDPAVQALAIKAKKGLGKTPKPIDLAQACRRVVAGHLTGTSLVIADGTASEAARTRSGDCTESAVLLAALLRFHGIPSRCVTGLVYSAQPFAGKSDVFVYHMGTQAWIEGADGPGYWLDLDAAMGKYSAGHLALGASTMGADAPADQAALLPFMQELKIKVIKTKH